MPTRPSTSMARCRACALPAPRCSRTVSEIWSPMVIVGFSDVIGSWKIMPISLPRTWRIWLSSTEEISLPSRTIFPPTMWPPGGRSRMMDSAVIVLPQPDSPTMPRHSPGSTVRLTPSRACTTALRSRISVRRPSSSSRCAIRPRHCAGCGVAGGLPALEPDLDGIPEPFADEDRCRDHDDDREPSREDLPPVPDLHVLDAVAEHAAPVLLRRRDAKAQVAQRHDERDGVGHLEGGVHHDRADRV